jgi:hypothetical protein
MTADKVQISVQSLDRAAAHYDAAVIDNGARSVSAMMTVQRLTRRSTEIGRGTINDHPDSQTAFGAPNLGRRAPLSRLSGRLMFQEPEAAAWRLCLESARRA